MPPRCSRSPATRRRAAAAPSWRRPHWQAGYQSEPEDVESVAGYVRHILEQLELEEADELLTLL